MTVPAKLYRTQDTISLDFYLLCKSLISNIRLSKVIYRAQSKVNLRILVKITPNAAYCICAAYIVVFKRRILRSCPRHSNFQSEIVVFHSAFHCVYFGLSSLSRYKPAVYSTDMPVLDDISININIYDTLR